VVRKTTVAEHYRVELLYTREQYILVSYTQNNKESKITETKGCPNIE